MQMYGFDKQSAERVAKVVRRVEGIPSGGDGRRAVPALLDDGEVCYRNESGLVIPKGGLVQFENRNVQSKIRVTRPEYGGLANLGVAIGQVAVGSPGWALTRGIVKLAVEDISKAKIGNRLGSKMNSFYAIPDESGTFLVLALLTDREALTAPAGYAVCMFTRHRGDYTYARDCKGTTRVRVASQVWILSPQLVATELQPGVVEISCP